MASHQNKEHTCFSRGGQLLTDLRWHNDVTVLPRSICYTWKDWYVGKASITNSTVSKTECVGVYTCVYARIYIRVHAHRKETELAGEATIAQAS